MRARQGIVVLACALAAACTGSHGGTTSQARPSVAGRPSVDATVAAAQAVSSLLARRAAAVLSHDDEAFLSTVDPTAAAPARQAQGRDFAAMVAVPFGSYSLAVATGPPALSLRELVPRWTPVTTATFTLPGDVTPSQQVLHLGFVRRGTDWYVDPAVAATPAPPELWDLGPVVVARGSASLVLAHPADAGRARELAWLADRAVPAVTAVWGRDWSRRVVVLLPRGEGELAALAQTSQPLSSYAAIESSELVGEHRGAERIVVNPRVFFGGSSGTARQVVMTHEVTHAASATATSGPVPSWLVEGFADYVGLLRVQVPVTVSAGVLAAAVRTGGVPSELPTDAAFGPRAVALESAYEQAWWACQLFARTYGQPALVRLYRTVGAGTGVDAAVRQVTGASLAAFRAAWRASIAAELG